MISRTLSAIRRRARMQLELLEQRSVPALIAWDGGPAGAGTNWLDPVNWVGDALPGVNDDAVINVTATGQPAIVGLHGVAAVRSVTVQAGASLTISSTIPSDALRCLASVTNSGTIRLDTGSLQSSQFNPGLPIDNRGVLAGTGQILATITNNGGTVEPGNPVGNLSITGPFTNSGPLGEGTIAVDINGLTPRIGYDQITQTLGMTLGGRLVVNVGFASSPGDTFTIINNADVIPIRSPFAGLSEGATVTANGQTFRLSYIGGTGNDVTLTRFDVNAPAIVVGDGTAQRSRITQLQAVFNQPIAYIGAPESAYLLQKIVGSVVTGTVALAVDTTLVGGHSVATITFASDTTFGSLDDGRYRLTVAGAQITTNGVPLGADYVSTFHRFYGDANGDGRIDIADFGQFSLSFNKSSGSPNYLDYFDYNRDGRIDAADFGQFSVRYFTTLP